jgi:hypothetical protein
MSNLRAGSLEDEAVTVIASVEAARERAAGAAGWASRRRRAGLGHGGLGVASVHRRLETLCGRSGALRSRSRVPSERLRTRRGAKRLQTAASAFRAIQSRMLRFKPTQGTCGRRRSGWVFRTLALVERQLAVRHRWDKAVGVGLEKFSRVAGAIEASDGPAGIHLEEIDALLEPCGAVGTVSDWQ